MKKEILSDAYELTEHEKFEGMLGNYQIFAEHFLFNWAKALWYWRRKKETGQQVHSYFVGENYRELEEFPETEFCAICEGLAGCSCWDVFEKLEKYMKDHKQAQTRHHVS